MCIDMFLYWYILLTSLQRRYLLILPATWSSSQIGLFFGASVLEMMHTGTWYIYITGRAVCEVKEWSQVTFSALVGCTTYVFLATVLKALFIIFFIFLFFSESEIIESCRNCLQWRERDCVDYSLTPKGVIFVYL